MLFMIVSFYYILCIFLLLRTSFLTWFTLSFLYFYWNNDKNISSFISDMIDLVIILVIFLHIIVTLNYKAVNSLFSLPKRSCYVMYVKVMVFNLSHSKCYLHFTNFFLTSTKLKGLVLWQQRAGITIIYIKLA